MSRPPRPHYHTTTTGDRHDPNAKLDYLPLEFEGLLELSDEAATGAGLVLDRDARDMATTLVEMSGLVGHILALYQDRYAAESFLSTAQASSSLVRHARRLAYEPDPGMSATGYAVVIANDDVEPGTVAAGLALKSGPRGELAAQTFETTEDLELDPDHNALSPAEPTVPVTLAAGAHSFLIAGTGHRLQRGDRAILVGPSLQQGFTVWDAVEQDEGTTEVFLDPSGAGLTGTITPPELDPDDPEAGYRLLAQPARELQRFGWNADPVQFPPAQLSSPSDFVQLTTASDTAHAYGYEVDLDGGSNNDIADTDLYLASKLDEPLAGSWVMQAPAGTPYYVHQDATATLSFHHGQWPTALAAAFETHISGTVSLLRLRSTAGSGANLTWTSQPWRCSYLTGWKVEAALVAEAPSSEPLFDADNVCVLAGELEGLGPGQYLALESLDGETAEVRQITAVTPDGGATEVTALPVDDATALSWTLDDVVIRANVVPISHGVTVEETLGGSDGITPFLRFTLRDAPVAILPAATPVPALEVRVADVAWVAVEDFRDSGPRDRHYRIERDQDQTTHIVFGDGERGGIPPSGKRHIQAAYRVGIGRDGNVAARRVSRLKKAHPLIARAYNPTALGGGADPAAAADIRRQATRYVRTFDRAVSVSDHADLALLYSGVARASASWDDSEGVRLVVADADGDAITAPELLEFLEERRDNAVPLTLVAPEAVPIWLTLTVQVESGYLAEVVFVSVREALFGSDEDDPGLFAFAAREFAQPAHLSEVYEAVAAVEGVDFVEVTFFGVVDPTTSPAEPVADVIHADPAQWLELVRERCQINEGTS